MLHLNESWQVISKEKEPISLAWHTNLSACQERGMNGDTAPITHIPGLLIWRMCARIYEGCRSLPHGKIPRRAEPMSAAKEEDEGKFEVRRGPMAVPFETPGLFKP